MEGKQFITYENSKKPRITQSTYIEVNSHALHTANPFTALGKMVQSYRSVTYYADQTMVIQDGTSERTCRPDVPQLSYLDLLLILRSPFGTSSVCGGVVFKVNESPDLGPFDGKRTVFTRPSAFDDDPTADELNPFIADPTASNGISQIAYFEGQGMIIDWEDSRVRPKTWHVFPAKIQKYDYILRLLLMTPYSGHNILGTLKIKGIVTTWSDQQLIDMVGHAGPSAPQLLSTWVSPRAVAQWKNMVIDEWTTATEVGVEVEGGGVKMTLANGHSRVYTIDGARSILSNSNIVKIVRDRREITMNCNPIFDLMEGMLVLNELNGENVATVQRDGPIMVVYDSILSDYNKALVKLVCTRSKKPPGP